MVDQILLHVNLVNVITLDMEALNLALKISLECRRTLVQYTGHTHNNEDTGKRESKLMTKDCYEDPSLSK